MTTYSSTMLDELLPIKFVEPAYSDIITFRGDETISELFILPTHSLEHSFCCRFVDMRSIEVCMQTGPCFCGRGSVAGGTVELPLLLLLLLLLSKPQSRNFSR